jgi:hypothetical protein
MFGKAAMQREIDDLKRVNRLVAEANAILLSRAYLTDIAREGRTLTLTFQRGSETHTLETYATMGDNIAAMKKLLLE